MREGVGQCLYFIFIISIFISSFILFNFIMASHLGLDEPFTGW